MQALTPWIALIAGAVYLIAWGLYRIVRRREHRILLAQHSGEAHRRATWGDDIDDDEVRRRRQWDAEHGPLLSPLSLKDREESRWPIGAAVQGAAAITASVLIAAVLTRPHPSTAGRDVEDKAVTTTTGPSDTPAEQGAAIKTAVPALVPTAGVVAISLLFLATGVTVMFTADSRIVRAAGATLAISAPILSGLKLLSVDKLITTNELIRVHYSPYYSSPAPERVIAGVTGVNITLAPFATGQAVPSKRMRCSARVLADKLASDRAIISVAVIGRADRRGLRSALLNQYAGNWGLAQKRAACIATILEQRPALAKKVFVTAAGPILGAAAHDPETELASDRRVSLFVQSANHDAAWVSALSSKGEWPLCTESEALSDEESCE